MPGTATTSSIIIAHMFDSVKQRGRLTAGPAGSIVWVSGGPLLTIAPHLHHARRQPVAGHPCPAVAAGPDRLSARPIGRTVCRYTIAQTAG
jgi:hypothetical protein